MPPVLFEGLVAQIFADLGSGAREDVDEGVVADVEDSACICE